jgi:hypothetical protein
MGKKILTGLIGFAGVGISALALFAQKLGIARGSHWGFGRFVLLGVGLAFVLGYLLILTWNVWVRGWEWFQGRIRGFFVTCGQLLFVQKVLGGIGLAVRSLQAAWHRFPAVKWSAEHLKPPLAAAARKIRNSGLVRYFSASPSRAAALAAVCLGVIVVTIYVWFVSVGRWIDWPKNTNYYDKLAAGFSHGQPYLLEKPDPALARLADPYDFVSRGRIHILWDVSYFDGKYFLYWGPAPALVLMGVHLFTSQPIGDEVLVFSFVTGTFLFSTLLILNLRRRLYPNLDWKYVPPAIIIAGFANPLPWLLNRPAIYEAAISGGQLFLLAGLYFCLTALEGQPGRYWKLALASLCWVGAMSSRLTLAPATFFLTAMAGLYVMTHSDRRAGRCTAALALGLPMGAGLAGLLWYNKIRFNAWFEFGLRYSLTGLNYHKYYSEAFSLANFLPNFNNYLINPFRTLTIFPYIKPDWGGRLLFFYFKSPAHYFSEQVSGLIPTLPFVLFALIPLFYVLRAGWRKITLRSKAEAQEQPRAETGLKEWTFATLCGAGLLAFAPILFFITSNMRYLADPVPTLVILSILGFWQGVEALTDRPTLRRIFIALVVILVAYSAMVSLLLAVTGNEARFENLNPALFEKLTHWFTFW